jgi:hypothetical protein
MVSQNLLNDPYGKKLYLLIYSHFFSVIRYHGLDYSKDLDKVNSPIILNDAM